ncbi:hypothetical protein ACQKLP_09105 [Chitinophaga sp. NPDC101104]|uniref:hypothetical protein n=1 Tax=Chitinophaga sp. NPDC101104 TaxID=3390561 RepID=UPI003D0740E1
MKSTPFDLRVFIRIALFYLAGVAATVGLLVLFQDFDSKAFHWLVAGIDFFVFPAALMVGIGRFHANIVVLTLVFVLIAWGVLFGQMYYDENEIVLWKIRAGSSVITAVAIVVAIHNVVRLRFPMWTIVATALCKIIAF